MFRIEDHAPIKTVQEQLLELLKANPGILTGPFAALAQKRGLKRNRGCEFLKDGVQNGTIRVENEGRKRKHFWRGAEGKLDRGDSQGEFPSRILTSEAASQYVNWRQGLCGRRIWAAEMLA